MVLTRLSHVGEVCPLRDHSYSDPVITFNPHLSSRRVVQPAKITAENSAPETENGETSSDSSSSSSVHFLDFPAEIIEKIFSYLSFKNIGEIRRVCKRFDKIGANLLNIAFQRLQKVMLNKFQATKSRMPRRESARRKHPLARESDILETLLMRLTLLQMTFGKHIEKKHCCFFAGEVLDEVYRILHCVKSSHNMGKIFKITDELFDLTAMAMEYFREHIEPGLPEIFNGSESFEETRFSEDESCYSLGEGVKISELDEDNSFESGFSPRSSAVLRKRMRKMKQGLKRYSSQISVIRKELKSCRSKIADQSKQNFEYLSRMDEYEKKLDDTTKKFEQIFQELSNTKSELQYWRSQHEDIRSYYVCCQCGHSSGSSSSGSENRYFLQSIARPPSFPSYQHTPLSLSPSSSVKNLEHLFELDNISPSCSSSSSEREDRLLLLPSPSVTPLLFAEEERTDHHPLDASYKRASSDEDTEAGDSDTVGKRVKTRKRAKLESH